jgi:hypothetical protein
MLPFHRWNTGAGTDGIKGGIKNYYLDPFNISNQPLNVKTRFQPTSGGTD